MSPIIINYPISIETLSTFLQTKTVYDLLGNADVLTWPILVWNLMRFSGVVGVLEYDLK